MKIKFILHLIMAIIATILLVFNIVFNPLFWLKIIFAFGIGALNGYCITKTGLEFTQYKKINKLFKQAEKEFMHYVEWQDNHKDMSIEEYFKYHGCVK